MVPGVVTDLPQDDGSPALLESDLILAAELGQALLERNEELTAQLEQKEREIEVQFTLHSFVLGREILVHLLGLTESFWVFVWGISVAV